MAHDQVVLAITKNDDTIPPPELCFVEDLEITITFPVEEKEQSWLQSHLWPSSLLMAAPSLQKLSVNVSVCSSIKNDFFVLFTWLTKIIHVMHD